MDLSADIPARLLIAGHWCFVHYKGQKKLCFSCGREGHTLSTCPSRAVRPSASDVPPAGDAAVSTVIPSATVSVVAPGDTSAPPTTIAADAGSSNHHTAVTSSAVPPLRELASAVALAAPPADPVEVAVDDGSTAVVLDGEGSVTTVGAVAPLADPVEVAVDDVSTLVGLDGNGLVPTIGALSGRSKRPDPDLILDPLLRRVKMSFLLYLIPIWSQILSPKRLLFVVFLLQPFWKHLLLVVIPFLLLLWIHLRMMLHQMMVNQYLITGIPLQIMNMSLGSSLNLMLATINSLRLFCLRLAPFAALVLPFFTVHPLLSIW